MSEEKERLDVLITQRALATSREKARAYIMAGVVFVDGQKEDKAGLKVKINSNIEIKQKMKYVSRGGFKLEKAIQSFKLDLNDKICMDVGASTGGFTDCMLQEGAKKVYAIDVGYGQLAWSLRQNEKVVSLEKTNMRYVTDEQISEKIDFSSVDVSFISLKKILEPIKALLVENGHVVALIKPQFEAGREEVKKHGVVKDPLVHQKVISNIWDYAIQIGFSVCGLDFSPIKGPEGNREYLIYLSNFNTDLVLNKENIIADIVQLSHKEL
ncbi:rRNA methyltransferase [Candidatus Epulonipiscioides gigas]|nr:rRNA methyltransferase [Epulopiscium sp. SCG-C07WGA-EpuloA2]